MGWRNLMSEKLKVLESKIKEAGSKVMDSGNEQLKYEQERIAVIEKEIDRKTSTIDTVKSLMLEQGDDVNEQYEGRVKKLEEEIKFLNKEYAMSQEIIQLLKHNFENGYE